MDTKPLQYESAEPGKLAEEAHFAHEVRPPRGTPPYERVAVSCAAGLVALTVLALTVRSPWVWGPAVALIPPVQLLGLFFAWQAIVGGRRVRRIGWLAVILNLAAIGLGALFVLLVHD